VIRKARELVENVGEYTEVLGKRQDTIVMELKKHTYIKQNEHLLEDSGSESEQDQPAVVMDDALSLDSKVSKIASKLSLHKQAQSPSKPKGKQMPEFPPGAETLLRSLDIDREIFREELFSLRDQYWEIQEDILNTYDFGLLLMECGPIKDKITKHIKKLIGQLENYQVKDFLVRMLSIQKEIKLVTQKIEDSPAESIDEVMMLLDYIEVVRRPESKVDEISGSIWAMKAKMDFMLEMEIMLDAEAFKGYLDLVSWPMTFRRYLDRRRFDLLSAKEKLFALMASEKAIVYDKIAEIKRRMDLIVRDEGLIRENEIDKSKWNIVKPRLLKRDSESRDQAVAAEALPPDNPNSPTLKRKQILERKANKQFFYAQLSKVSKEGEEAATPGLTEQQNLEFPSK
jgi:hypothetical protein